MGPRSQTGDRAGDHTLAYRGLDRLLFKGPHVAVPNGGDWVSIFGTECDKAVAAGVLPRASESRNPARRWQSWCQSLSKNRPDFFH